MKKYAVIGAGFFGTNLAKSLSEHGAEVIVLDKNPHKVDALKDTVSKCVTVDVTNKEMLARLVPTNTDKAIVCIGRNLQANLIVCLNLQSLGIKHIISKCHSAEHKKILELMGIEEIINPEEEAAKMLSNKLIHPNIIEQIPLKSGYTVIEVKPTKDLIGKKLKDTEIRKTYGINIIGIRTVVENDQLTEEELEAENRKGLNLTPDGDTVISEKDLVIAVGEDDTIKKFFG